MPCVYTTPAGLCDGTQALSKNDHHGRQRSECLISTTINAMVAYLGLKYHSAWLSQM
jgi:hypothetical protein